MLGNEAKAGTPIPYYALAMLVSVENQLGFLGRKCGSMRVWNVKESISLSEAQSVTRMDLKKGR